MTSALFHMDRTKNI